MTACRPLAASVALAALLVAGCSHSDPGVTGLDTSDGPLDPASPSRLTYSPITDAWPGYSPDGDYLVYTFERGGSPDRCLGVLPGGGGQRVAEVCPEVRPAREGIEHGAVSPDGTRLAYTLHTGGTSDNFTVVTAALYVAPIDSVSGARKIFDLLVNPSGAPRRWDYLLDPVWIADDEIAFIGAQVSYVPPAPFADPDTIYTGIDLATVRIGGPTPVIDVIANISNAQALSYDPTVQRFTYLRDGAVYTIARGGSEQLAFTLPDAPGESGRGISGVAAGGGRIWITWITSMAIGTTTTRTTSSVSEVGAGGALVTLASRTREVAALGVISDQGRWGRLTAAGDGSRLAVEGLGGATGSDIYLISLP